MILEFILLELCAWGLLTPGHTTHELIIAGVIAFGVWRRLISRILKSSAHEEMPDAN